MIYIGSIKTTDVKTASKELINADSSKFGLDFVENKKYVRSLNIIKDKKIINQMAGYITRSMKIKSRKEFRKTIPQRDESA